MSERLPKDSQVIFCLLLAFALWAAVFGLKIVNFWLGLSLASAALAVAGIFLAGPPVKKKEINLRGAVFGLSAAALLYFIFLLGNIIGPLIFSFAEREIDGIYSIKQEGGTLVITMMLIFVTSPAEEIFWRGFLQRFAMSRLGSLCGLLAAASLYAAAHIVSGNVMLVLAALTAGLFWGALYLYSRSVFVCIISHIAWTLAIFVLWPMNQ